METETSRRRELGGWGKSHVIRMEQAWGGRLAHLQGLGPGSRDSKLGAGAGREGGWELPRPVSVTIELA